MVVTAQIYIDTEFTDLFTDASARYSQYGIDSLAQGFWSFAITMRGGIFTIRVYLNGVLANVDTASTVPLATSTTIFRVTRSPSTDVSSTAASTWTNVSTGIYTVDLSGTSFTAGSHLAYILASATYTNPAVAGKTSVISQSSATYAQQTLTSTWTAESMDFAVNSTGQFVDGDLTNLMPAHQHIDAFAADLAIERP